MKFIWQLKRLELKLKQFAEVETFLMKECEQVERTRQRIAAECARMISARFGSAGVTSPMSLPGVGPSMVNNMPATIGNKWSQLHLHNQAFRDITTTNQYIPTCRLCHGSKCLGWGQGCPCQQYSSHLLQMSCSTLQGMYSLLSIILCFDLYLVLALV